MFCVSSPRCYVFVLTFLVMLTCFFLFIYASCVVYVLMSPSHGDAEICDCCISSDWGLMVIHNAFCDGRPKQLQIAQTN